MKKLKAFFENIFLAGAIAAAAALLFFNVFIKFSAQTASGAVDFGTRVIVIDAGHGGFDPGAVYGGVNEKDINLRIALQLREFFTASGYTVVMTRETDCSTESEDLGGLSSRKKSDILNRVALAEQFNDSVMISIHQNAFSDTSQNGAQIFYGTVNPNSEPLAESIRLAIKSGLQADNRREIKKGTSSIYILDNCTVPTVLVECGFISNAAERNNLLDDEYIRKLAFCIYCGYLSYENTIGE